MKFAYGERGAEIWPVFWQEHQDIGYSTLEKEGIGGVHLKQVDPKMKITPRQQKLQVFGTQQNYEMILDHTDPMNII